MSVIVNNVAKYLGIGSLFGREMVVGDAMDR